MERADLRERLPYIVPDTRHRRDQVKEDFAFAGQSEVRNRLARRNKIRRVFIRHRKHLQAGLAHALLLAAADHATAGGKI
jgi:hypothetical protein